jgi:hypothetical protein
MASPVPSKVAATTSSVNGIVHVNPTVVMRTKPYPTATKKVPYRDFLQLRDMYGSLRCMLQEGGDIKYKNVRDLVDKISTQFGEMEELMENDQPNNGDVLEELRESRDILDKLDHDREHQYSLYGMVQSIDKRIYDSENLMKDVQAAFPYFNEVIEDTNNNARAVAGILKDRDAMVKDDIDFLVKECLDAKVRMTTRMLERETKWRSIVDDLILLALPTRKSCGREEESGDSSNAKPDNMMERKRKGGSIQRNEIVEVESQTYEFGKAPRWG